MIAVGMTGLLVCLGVVLLPVGIALAWAKSTTRSFIWAIVIPVMVSVLIYWMPEMGNSDKSEARAWAGVAITTMAIAGIAGSLLGLVMGKALKKLAVYRRGGIG